MSNTVRVEARPADAPNFRITSRGRHALLAMIALSKKDADTPIPLFSLSEECGISLSYLEQLFSALKKHKLVQSNRGPGGGYRLSRPADQLSIADIFIAAEDGRYETAKEDPHDAPVLTRPLWHEIEILLHGILSKISLFDLKEDRLKNLPILHELKNILK